MVDRVRIAAHDVVLLQPRELGLDAHRVGSGGSGRLLGLAEQLEQPAEVREVGRAGLGHVALVLEVVLAIGQAEAGLIERGDHLGRVGEVLLRADREQREHALGVQRDDRSGRRARVADLGDRVEQRLDRRDAGALDRGLVHAGRVVRADLVERRIAGGAPGRGVEHLVQQVLAVLDDDLDRAPRRTIRRNRRGLEEAAAGEGVEVGAGIDAGVDPVRHDARLRERHLLRPFGVGLARHRGRRLGSRGRGGRGRRSGWRRRGRRRRGAARARGGDGKQRHEAHGRRH
jgi:hypothetical protein